VSKAGDVFEDILDLLSTRDPLASTQASGQGVRVCVIDSGVDRARLAEGLAKEGVEPGPIEGAVFREDRNEPLPDEGRPSSPHGTTVADIIFRIAPRITLFSADVFGPSGSCDARVVIRAMRHAMDVWGCKVLNLSLGIPEPRLQIVQKRLELQRAIEEAYYRDVMVIAAASNDHPVTRSYPAAFAPPLLSVDKGAFLAPDEFAYRLLEQVEFQANGTGYFGPFATQPATSWAAPHLTGIVARLLSRRPSLKPFEMKAILYWLFQAKQRQKA
jgi:hypothetical protein